MSLSQTLEHSHTFANDFRANAIAWDYSYFFYFARHRALWCSAWPPDVRRWLCPVFSTTY